MKEYTDPDYYVIFWEKRTLLDDGDPETEYRLRLAYRLSGCASVEEAIEWEKSNANGREAATLIPVLSEDGKSDMLFVLHGTYPAGSETDPDGLFGWTMYRPDNAPPAI
ncbi:hypothetical protein KRX51_09515 [Corynebacterium sp. TAE3-ERU12]|uniref:hypothetical protein n=1 Tax=Corynebacterium sp. TAE3-ERU12 TaxID=2849491 RepID=UPI001C447F08|nr:hypothetical protein [Corynebacterium sp. TAE3-ERU12]MBV7296146.1 hypothetical protein [Corynebacterium sp. TAE3-ERU12]